MLRPVTASVPPRRRTRKPRRREPYEHGLRRGADSLQAGDNESDCPHIQCLLTSIVKIGKTWGIFGECLYGWVTLKAASHQHGVVISTNEVRRNLPPPWRRFLGRPWHRPPGQVWSSLEMTMSGTAAKLGYLTHEIRHSQYLGNHGIYWKWSGAILVASRRRNKTMK